MGNLICCYGENRNNKRGGTNVKTLLRKTEKPGKRRRIDDLVRDALRREEREDRQKRKKEKKGNTRPVVTQEHVEKPDTEIKEPLEVQDKKKEDGADEVNVKEEHTEDCFCEESSNSADIIEGCNAKVRDEVNDQVSLSTDTSSNSNIADVPTCTTFHSQEDGTWTRQSDIEPEDSTDGKENTDATESGEEEEAITDQTDESKITIDTKTVINGIKQGPEEDTEVTTRCRETTADIVNSSSAHNDDDGEIQMTGTVLPECVSGEGEEEDLDNRPNRNIGSCLENERVSSDEAVPSLEISCDAKLDNQLHEPNDSFCDEAEDTGAESHEYNDAGALSDLCDDKYSDLRVESLPDESCKLNDAHRDLDEETLYNTYNEEHKDANTGLGEREDRVDDDKTVDSLRVHSDTDSQPTCDGDVTTTHNDDKVDILKVHGNDAIHESDEDVPVVHYDVDILKIHDTYSIPGFEEGDTMVKNGDTVDKKKISDDESLSGWDEGDTMANTDATVDVLKVHGRDTLPDYCDNGRRHNIEDEENFMATDVDSELEYDNTDLTNNTEGDEECFSATGVGLELKSNLQSSTMSWRQCVTSVDLKKNLMNQALAKYGVIDSITNNGKKPQIKEIERLKQDIYNFPPKLSQLTEQDRHGSIRDLKWSRHMRTKSSRDKWMKRFELEELMFLNDGDTPDNDVSEARDMSRAPSPVPGTGSRFIKNNVVRPTTPVDKISCWSSKLSKDF